MSGRDGAWNMSDGRVIMRLSCLLLLLDEVDVEVLGVSVSPFSCSSEAPLGHLVNGIWTNAGSTGVATANEDLSSLVENIVEVVN